MNEMLEQLLSDCASGPGALACGVCLADRTHHVCSYHEAYTLEAMEKTMLHLTNAMALLSNNELVTQRLVWSFADGKIYVATRPDGSLFGLVAMHNENTIEFFERMVLRFYLI